MQLFQKALAWPNFHSSGNLQALPPQQQEARHFSLLHAEA